MNFFKDVEQLHKDRVESYEPPPTLKVLVSGFTRGGTTYTTGVLKNLGLAAGHEALFAAGNLWDHSSNVPDIVVEVSGISALWVPTLKEKGVKIVHLLRHPVPCINSHLSYFRKQDFTWSFLCETYLQYHKLIEAHADHTIYIERFQDGLPGLLKLLRVKRPTGKTLEKALNADRNHRRKDACHAWKDLPKELQEYAESHGYTEKA